MNSEMIVFMLVVFLTFFLNAIQWYTSLQTYPLFNWVGDNEFVSYHHEYERRLYVTLYLPYALLALSTIALFFVRPPSVSVGWVIALVVLELAIVVETFALAVPVHIRLVSQGKNTDDIARLVRYQHIRLIIASVASGIVLFLLAQIITA